MIIVIFGATSVGFVAAQASPSASTSKVSLPDEAAGLDEIVRALMSAFDQVDIIALGEAHDRRADSDLRIALVSHPDFARKVRSIVIECASTTEQSTLDRYIRGENVPLAQVEKIWKTTTQAANGFCDSPIYSDFLAAVRKANEKLPAGARIRVLGGDPGPGDNRSREVAAVGVLKEQVLDKHEKALVIYGSAHFYRNMSKIPDYAESMGEDIGLISRLDADFPGRIFAVIPVGLLGRPTGVTGGIDPDYSKFDRALKTQVRPVLVSLWRMPFRDLTAEEFLGNTLTNCRSGCRSVFKDSTLTLGQMADACVYFGHDPIVAR